MSDARRMLAARSCPTARCKVFDWATRNSLSALWIVVLAWLFLVHVAIGEAQNQISSPLPIQAVVKLQVPGEMSPMGFSPDGQWLAYVVHTRPSSRTRDDYEYLRTGVPWWGVGCDIFVVNTRTEVIRNLTGGKGNNWLPVWSPDNRYLAFLSDRDATSQSNLWIWNLSDNDLRKASDLSIRMQLWERIEWTPDSRRVIVAALPEGMSLAEYLTAATYEGDSTIVRPSDWPTPTVHLYGGGLQHSAEVDSNTMGLSGYLHDLVSLDVGTGTVNLLVHREPIAMFHLFPDGRRVAFTRPRKVERPGSQQMLHDIVVVSLAEHREQVIASSIRLNLAGAFSISPDGVQLSYRASGLTPDLSEICIINANGLRVATLPVHSEGTDNLTRNQWPFSTTPLWDATGRYLYFLMGGELWRASVRERTAKEITSIPGHQIIQLLWQSAGLLWTSNAGQETAVISHDVSTKSDSFYKVNLSTGLTSALLDRGECYSYRCIRAMEGQFVSVSADGRYLAYFAEEARRPADLWLTNAAFEKPRVLSSLNPFIQGYKMGEMRTVEWMDDDGERLSGALLLPSSYQPGHRYPLVVSVYGGELLSDAATTFGGYMRLSYYNAQLLATRGYAVLMPDAPQRLGEPMLDLVKTVLPGVNKIIELGIADPESLGVMGQSYGGYSALCLITQTRRFKAAVESDGFGDLVALYGEMKKDGSAFGTSSETGQALMGGSPWDYRNRYIENSPIMYLDRVETPLLIVHGTEDTTVDSFLGNELFVGLRRLGKQVEYASYEGESHEVYSYANQLDLCRRIIEWFDGHLKHEAHE